MFLNLTGKKNPEQLSFPKTNVVTKEVWFREVSLYQTHTGCNV